jgi:hypothetical protein
VSAGSWPGIFETIVEAIVTAAVNRRVTTATFHAANAVNWRAAAVIFRGASAANSHVVIVTFRAVSVAL